MDQKAPSRFSSMPGRSADLDQTWAYLRNLIDYVMSMEADLSFVDYTNLYTTVYNYCTSTKKHSRTEAGGRTGANLMGSDLYNKLSGYFLQHFQPMMELSESLQDVDLLQYYAAEWDRYTTGAKYLNRMFAFLNRHWVKRERDEGKKGIYQIYTLALAQWNKYFLAHIQKDNAKLTNAVLRLITQQRNGELIDQDLVKKVLDSFVSLGLDSSDPNKECLDVYRDQFETAFLRATENHYTAASEAFLAENTVSDYLKKAEGFLTEEEARVERYLQAKPRRNLVSTCEHVLIHAHSELMWESFESLLDHDKDEDLQRMCALLSRIPGGLEPVHKMFEARVKRAGLNAISKLVGEGGVNVESLDPKAYVDTLFEVHCKESETVKRAFKGEAGFTASLVKACRDFVNRNAATGLSSTKSPEVFATYADTLLRKNNEMAAELEDALNRVVILFKYLEDKDVFQTSYAVKLSKRLIRGASGSDESEASMISKLKQVCEFEYTNKLQRMFTDMSLSQDLTNSFKDHLSRNDIDITFSIMVLGANFWPLHPPAEDFVIPREIIPTFDRFRKYYQTKHSGRKLSWLWNYSKNELRTNYLNQKYILMTSSYQMAVLLQYNKHDRLSLDELVSATAISRELLTHVLASLVKAKLLIDKVQGQYDLNPGFKSKKIRVNLNLAVKAGVGAESNDVLKAMNEDRKYVIQATIVRIMKARKTMKMQALVQEVVSQTSQRFLPKIPDIKKAIESLIERDYIERTHTKDTFAYVD